MWHGPPVGDDLAKAEAQFGRPFPDAYRELMSDVDGGEASINGQTLVLWRAAELVPFNEYAAEEYAGFWLFGSNGSSENFAFDTRDGSMTIVMIPSLGDPDDAVFIADSFETLFASLAKGIDWARGVANGRRRPRGTN